MGADEDIYLASNARQKRAAPRNGASSSPRNASQGTPNGHFRRIAPPPGSLPTLQNAPQDRLARYRIGTASRVSRQQQTPSQSHEPVIISSDTEADGDDEEDEDSDQAESFPASQKARQSPRRANGTGKTQPSLVSSISRAGWNSKPFHNPDDYTSQPDNSSFSRADYAGVLEQEDGDADQPAQGPAKEPTFFKSVQATSMPSTVPYAGSPKSSFLFEDHASSHRRGDDLPKSLSPTPLPPFSEYPAPLSSTHLEIDRSASEFTAINEIEGAMSLPHRALHSEKQIRSEGWLHSFSNIDGPNSQGSQNDFNQHSVAKGAGHAVPLRDEANPDQTATMSTILYMNSKAASFESVQDDYLEASAAEASLEAGYFHNSANAFIRSPPERNEHETAGVEPAEGTGDESSNTQFPLSFQAVEQAVRSAVNEILNENIYASKYFLARARALENSRATSNFSDDTEHLVGGAHTVPEQFLQKKSPFARMQALQVPGDDDWEDEMHDLFNIETIVNTAALRTGTIRVPKIRYKCEAIGVPKHYQYARLRNNFLGENFKEILIEPFRDDPVQQDKTDDEVPEFYMLRSDDPSDTGRRRWYMEYMGPLLRRLGISWNDILQYLLDPEIDTADANGDVRKAIEERQAMLQQKGASQGESEEVEKLNERGILDRLQPSSQRNIYMAALLDNIFFEEAEFSLFSLAKANIPGDGPASPEMSGGSDGHLQPYRSLTCRICFIHDCREHGLIFEDPKEVDALSSNEEPNGDDSEEGNKNGPSTEGKGGQKRKRASLEGTSHREDASPKGFNHKFRITRNTAKEADKTDDVPKPTFKPVEHLRDLGRRHMVIPCNHKGSCEQARCRCFRLGIYCEKMCGCAKSCPRRYPGCKCAKRDSLKQRNGSRLCRNKCKCFELNRECDPDLCGNCGVDEVLDPANKYNDDLQKSHCGNCGITKGVPMKTYLTNSPYHGFGIILGEPAKPNDFIMEYKGEILTEQEATRRENVVHPRDTSYFYTADRERVIDATLAGSKHRFVNHSDGKTRNCYARVKLCNGVARLGLYASGPIKVGEELLFNYMMPEDHMVRHGGSKKRPSKPKRTAERSARKQGESTVSQLERVKQYWRDTEGEGNGSTTSNRRRRKLDIQTDNDSDEHSVSAQLNRSFRRKRKTQAANAGALTETEAGPNSLLRRRRPVRRAREADGFMTEPEGQQRSAARQISQKTIGRPRRRVVPDTEDESSTRPDNDSEAEGPLYRGSETTPQIDLTRDDTSSDPGEGPSSLPQGRSSRTARLPESLLYHSANEPGSRKRKASSHNGQDSEIGDSSTVERGDIQPGQSGEVVAVKQVKRVRLME